jgi:Zn-dependent oligopeptidase
VCSHPDRADIDARIAEGGGSNRSLARTYLLSEDAIARHKRNHLPKAVVQAAQEKGAERGADLLSRIRSAEAKLMGYEKVAYNLAHKGIRTGDDALVLRALSEARRSAVESRMRLWDLELRVTETRQIAERLEDVERRIGEDSWAR